MPNRLIQLASTYFGVSPQSLISTPIQKGASGRTICRLQCTDKRSVIGIHNDGQRPENADFVGIAQWLHDNGVPVPEIKAVDGDCCLTEDLGNTDLLHFHQSQTWPQSRSAYFSTLDGLQKLQQLPIKTSFPLKRKFDTETYLWEQNYFFEHFWGTHLQRRSLPDLSPFQAIAQELGQSMPVLVHRDFQSQNLMVSDTLTHFIDFQGLRPGQAEYDLASLVFDPYTRLTSQQQEEILNRWKEIGGSFDQERFLQCSLQRLMQALGAFANISHNFGNNWYLQHIEPACHSLEIILRKLGLASLNLSDLVSIKRSQ